MKLKEKLLHKADVIEGVVTDVLETNDSRLYDVILAIGLFDYCTDWYVMLNKLLNRTKGILIADFPKTGTLHNFMRHIWLGLRHVKLYSAYKKDLEKLFTRCCVQAEIIELPLNWMVKIRKVSQGEL